MGGRVQQQRDYEIPLGVKIFFALLRSSILVQRTLRVYPQNSMGTKLLTSVLVLLLSGADAGAALICAASCRSAAPVTGAVAHHHKMKSQPSATHSSRQHTHHHGAPCAECPPKAGNSLNQKSDCHSLSKNQARTEGSFSLDAPTGVARVLTNSPADGRSDGQQSFPFGASPSTRSSGPPSLPLRI